MTLKSITWEVVGLILGIVLALSETYIRIRNGSKGKTSEGDESKPSQEYFREKIEMERRIIILETKVDTNAKDIETLKKEIETIKSSVVEIEKDSIESISRISDKLDNLSDNILKSYIQKK